jgi:signal transduction histidine kinase
VLVLWGLVAWLVLDGKLNRLRWLNMQSPSHQVVIGATVIVGAGLLVVITVIIRLAWFARRLAMEISSLTKTADALAGEQLPTIVTALRNGEQIPADDSGIWPDTTVTEIAAASTAIADLYRAAVAAAAAEAALRHGFRQILISLGKRNQSLLHRQLRIIDGLEQQATNPAELADLFTLDHLTTRMRRHAESLTILSGAAAGRSWSGPVPVIDVMRAATAEVEDYTRVAVITDSEEAVTAQAVTDMIHLLAELIENATLFSPSTTRVEVRADRVANGFAIEVEDRGLGIPHEQLAQINARLANPPDFDLADADRLGLFVAGRLAARHGVHVTLTPSAYRGTKAVVVLPDSIVVAPAERGTDTRADSKLSISRTTRLNLRAPEVLSLAGAVLPGSASAEGEYGSSVPETVAVAVAVAAAVAIETEGAHAEVLASTTIHGLPRRIRPEPAPQPESGTWDLQRAVTSAGPAPRQVPPEGPAPEHARTLAASLQLSWSRSRETDQASDEDAPTPLHHEHVTDYLPDSAADSEES